MQGDEEMEEVSSASSMGQPSPASDPFYDPDFYQRTLYGPSEETRGNPYSPPHRTPPPPCRPPRMNPLTNPVSFYNPDLAELYRPEQPTSDHGMDDLPDSPPPSYWWHMGLAHSPEAGGDDLQSEYALFTSDDPDFRPVGDANAMTSITAIDPHGPVWQACQPVECPLYLKKYLFRPVGPCWPTRPVRKQIDKYYAWLDACTRGGEPGCSEQDRMTNELAISQRRPGLLGDNDDPDAFWEPPAQYTLYPPEPRQSPYPIRAEAVPLKGHVTVEEQADFNEYMEAMAHYHAVPPTSPMTIYQLPIPLPAEVPEAPPRVPLYYHLSNLQPAEIRTHQSSYRPVRRTARYRFLLSD